jgi:carboxylate-amine ligase
MHRNVSVVSFASSDPLTLGIEEEFLLVDASDGLTPMPRADDLVDGEWQSIVAPGGWIKPELLRCSIELATAASDQLLQLDVDVRALRDEIVDRAERAGMMVAAIGMHPDLAVDDAMITPSPAHRSIAKLHRRIGTLASQSTHGIHVHVGVPSLDRALDVMQALAGCVPMLIACTANSPVAFGARAPWCSARSEVLRAVPWAGTTPRFVDVAEYSVVHALHQLENSGDQRFLWDVAPVPALGTVEIRCCDSNVDPDVALGVAALVQGVAAYVLDGGSLARPNESLERHNRWSATEFGPRARFLVAGHDEPVDVAQLVGELVELVRPCCADLGSEPWLDTFTTLLADPPVERAIDAFEQGGTVALLRASRVRRDEPDHDDA